MLFFVIRYFVMYRQDWGVFASVVTPKVQILDQEEAFLRLKPADKSAVSWGQNPLRLKVVIS